jgi:hypothetical protein
MSHPFMRSMIGQMISTVSGSSNSQNLGRVPFTGTVSAVYFTPNGAIASGDATNGRQFTLFNRGSAGTLSNVLARVSTGTANSAVNIFIADKPQAVALTSSASATVSAGDSLEWESLHTSSGIADPGGTLEVQIWRATS